MGLLINDLLEKSSSERERVILERLKELNAIAMQFLYGGYYTLKYKYHKLQREPIWKEAKSLIIEYILRNQGVIKCSKCKKEVDPIHCDLHHGDIDKKGYHWNEMFTPSVTLLLHSRCHNQIHEKERRSKNAQK